MTALSKTQLANPEAIAALPEKVLQFGEGNFLRGFVDWMIHKLNEQNLFNGRVAVVQPIAQGLTPMLNEQDGLYTLLLRGIQNGQIVEEKDIISCISRGINPYEDFAAYLELAVSPDLRFVVSNTTEAGIAYSAEDRYDDAPPATFPGKLTVLLHKRFTAFNGAEDKGLVIIPCELIERNGDNLKKIVLRLAEEWNLGAGFTAWIENSNYFLNTMVDRIVTGYPRDEIAALTEQLGYEDKLLNTAEIFHLWVIEGDKRFAEELPFHKVGLDVIWTDDMTPYRTRKVRILNGAHTMTVLAAYLYGLDTVKECMDDELIRSFMEKGIYNEVIPTLDLPDSELKAFAAAVTERFANPFIRHYLMSISLNSTSKFKTRVLPSILEYVNRKGELPKVLSFSLAALLAFYQGTELKDNALVGKRPAGNEYQINDDLPVLQMFASLWSKYDGSREAAGALVEEVLSHTEMWGKNLNEVEGFTALVSDYLYSILTNGVAATLKDVI